MQNRASGPPPDGPLLSQSIDLQPGDPVVRSERRGGPELCRVRVEQCRQLAHVGLGPVTHPPVHDGFHVTDLVVVGSQIRDEHRSADVDGREHSLEQHASGALIQVVEES